MNLFEKCAKLLFSESLETDNQTVLTQRNPNRMNVQPICQLTEISEKEVEFEDFGVEWNDENRTRRFKTFASFKRR